MRPTNTKTIVRSKRGQRAKLSRATESRALEDNSLRNPRREALDEKNAADFGHDSTESTTRTRSTTKHATKPEEPMRATHHVVHLKRSQTVLTSTALHPRGRGARGAPRRYPRHTHMGRGTRKSSAVFG